ncbi:MAG TPA: pantetheine-phosphate adenylyltransferase [Rubrobacteraceae bacterium]|nr:pantetheine-phosphate adenylyltransferase [Rubrobacteraceae bacterium]
MRVIAGEARGVRLTNVPPGVRPTADRVRESLFNRLGQFFDGGEVLDLYAGTGALGIEALSRGCERAVFVEKDRRAVAAIRENLRRTGFLERAEILRDDVGRALDALEGRGGQYNLIFIDPPYRIAALEVGSVLMRLRAILAPNGRAVVETGGLSPEVIESKKGESRRYGGTVVTIFERSDLTMNVAVCPGSFDPITAGHLDIIRRAAGIFDHVVIAVGRNLRKGPRLTASERAHLIETVTRDIDNVSVELMDGLLVDFAREQGARVIVKGLRAVSDFESEFEQAQLNRNLSPEIETVFIMSAAEYSFLSSSAVREIAGLGGDVRGLVPDVILDVVREIYSGSGEKTETTRQRIG